jgi:hypothetical protein
MSAPLDSITRTESGSFYDPRLLFWTQDEPVHNFGDFLSILLAERALLAPFFPADRYRLIGSALDETLIAADIQQVGDPAATIACWGCGARGPIGLSEQTMSRTAVLGLRGPLSRAALGMSEDTPLGDPALLLPLLYVPCAPQVGKTKEVLCIPHYNEPLLEAELLARTGATAVVSPRVVTLADCEALIDRIAAADFVLAGSLHAAIIAFAYGTAFAFLDQGFVDAPFKWQDFASLIGIEARWFGNAEDARSFAFAAREGGRWPALLPLLYVCPWTVRPDVLLAARAFDLEHGYADDPAVKQSFITQLRTAQWWRLVREREFSLIAEERVTEKVAQTVTATAARLEELRVQLDAEAAAARFRLYDGADTHPVMTFARGSAGSAMLQGRWVEPNEVAPITWANHSHLVLPVHSRWMAGTALILEGYLFAPHVGKLAGRRHLSIYLNGGLAMDTDLINPGDQESFVARIEVPLTRSLRERGGELDIHFIFAEQISPLGLGINAHDDRPIGYAPLRLWIE